MVVAAAAMVIAALAVVIALLGEPGSDPAETAALERARDDAAAAQEEADAATAMADAATAMADAAIVIAEEASAKAAAAEAALADASASAGETVDPEAIARLEAQLEEARNLAATALVAADAAVPAAGTDTAADDETPADETAEEAPAPEEPSPEEEPGSPDDPAAGDAPAPEDDDTGAAADLPGEPYEFGPPAGAALFVVGLPHDDVLNVRHLPAGQVVATLDPVNLADNRRGPFLTVRDAAGETVDELDLSDAVTATGLSRRLPTTVWYQLQAAGVTGWSSAAYLAQLGATADATAEVRAVLGESVTDDTLAGLALQVAGAMASREPPSRIVVTTPGGVVEGVADIGVDVVGLGDDSLLGYRLEVIADPAGSWIEDADPGPYTLTTVIRTAICARGVSDAGLCF